MRLPPLRKLVLAAAASLLALTAYFDAFGRALALAAPETALAGGRDDGRAFAELAKMELLEPEGAASVRKAERLAARALRSDPLNPEGLSALILSKAAAAELRAVDPMLDLADRVSRRAPRTNLLLIEREVSRGNITGALSRYDTALRASFESRQLLFPILTNALDDDQVQRAFAPYIAKNPSWLEPFIQYAIVESRTPGSIAKAILRGGGLPDGDAFRNHESSLLLILGRRNDGPALRAFFESLRGADPALAKTARIDAATTDPRFAPVSWELLNSADMTVRTGDGAMAISLAPGKRAAAASKVLFLAPGSYRVSGRFRFGTEGGGGAVDISLACLNGKAIAESQIATRTAPAPRPLLFAVPGNCQAQRIAIVVASGDSQTESQITVEQLRLEPLG